MLLWLPASLFVSLPVAPLFYLVPKTWGKEIFSAILLSTFCVHLFNWISARSAVCVLFVSFGLFLGGIGWYALYRMILYPDIPADPISLQIDLASLVYWGKILAIVMTMLLSHGTMYFGMAIRFDQSLRAECKSPVA